jgi:5-methylcytosine-specific restriction endonuclease McrA
MICEKCKCEHGGTYGSGRFCSEQCARAFSTASNRTVINVKVKKTWQRKMADVEYKYTCEKCGREFSSKKRLRKEEGRHVHCEQCRRKAPHVLDNPTSLTTLSLRTITKILKRAGIKCSICGWNKTSLDIHHILPVKNGGTGTDDNLIALCPNCHRMAHEKKYTMQELSVKNIKNMFSNWKDYYHPSN